MKKFSSSIIKVAVLSLLAAPLAFAANTDIATSSVAEPIYLSICGLILLSFGMIKGRNEA